MVQATSASDEPRCDHPVAELTIEFASAEDLARAVVEECAKKVAALAENTQELKLCLGEMTAQEMRTLRAGLNLAAHKLRLLKISD